jgi:hypothetical protein
MVWWNLPKKQLLFSSERMPRYLETGGKGKARQGARKKETGTKQIKDREGGNKEGKQGQAKPGCKRGR